MHVVGFKFTFVAAARVPGEGALATLVTILELSLKDGAIHQLLHSMAILHLHLPLALVSGAVAIGVPGNRSKEEPH